jgi:polyisoprenoid-binding protein YceI
MGFFDVTGDFQTFEGSLETNGDSLEGGSISAVVDVNSVNTNNAQRDGHLKSDDFFNAEQFPKLTFTSTSIVKNGDKYAITGDLTIRDITQSVVLDAVHAGKLVGMGGELRTGVQAKGTINRKTFGLSWGAMVEGVNVVSDNVDIILNVQLVKAD